MTKLCAIFLTVLFAHASASPPTGGPGYSVQVWGNPAGAGSPADWALVGPSTFRTNNADVPTALMLDGVVGAETGVSAHIRLRFLNDNDYCGLVLADHVQADGVRRMLFLSFTNGGDDEPTNDEMELYDVNVATNADAGALSAWVRGVQTRLPAGAAEPSPPEGVAADRLFRAAGADHTFRIAEWYDIRMDVENRSDPLDGDFALVALSVEAGGGRVASADARTRSLAPGHVGVYMHSQMLEVQFVYLGGPVTAGTNRSNLVPLIP